MQPRAPRTSKPRHLPLSHCDQVTSGRRNGRNGSDNSGGPIATCSLALRGHQNPDTFRCHTAIKLLQAGETGETGAIILVARSRHAASRSADIKTPTPSAVTLRSSYFRQEKREKRER